MSFSSGFTESEFFRKSNAFVDFFFVLSGFVLTHAYAGNLSLTFRKYMISRVFRIVPLHVFLLLIFLLLELALLLAFKIGFDIRGEPFSGKSAVAEILPNLLLVHAWTSLTNQLSFNGPSWSISVELFLYIAFFATLLVKGYVRTLIWCSISVLAGYLFVHGFVPINVYIFRGLFSFFLGVTAYSVYCASCNASFNNGLASVVEVGLVLGTFLIITFDHIHRFLACGAFFAVLVYVFAFERGVVSRLLKCKPFVVIGILSYSIYMTHYLVLSVVKTSILVLSKMFSLALIRHGEKMKEIDFGGPMINSLSAILIAVLVIYVSMLTHRYIERPGIKLGQKMSALRH